MARIVITLAFFLLSAPAAAQEPWIWFLTDGCSAAIRGGMLKTCADGAQNGSWSGNPGDVIIAPGPAGVPARYRTIIPNGVNVPVLHTSRDGVTNVGQPAVWLLPPGTSMILSPKTAGLITLGTSGGTALFQVDCSNAVVRLAIPDLRGLFADRRDGVAPLAFYHEADSSVMSCVITNQGTEDRLVGVNNLGGG